MIRLTHFVAIDMKTRLFITDIRKISFDRVGELSPERAERVQRCRRDDDKLRCIAGGLFMNKFLGGAKITVNEFGKPECDNGLCFNISHSGSYVLFALSDSEVGCDIEEMYIDCNQLNGDTEAFRGLTAHGFIVLNGNGYPDSQLDYLVSTINGEFTLYN